MEIINKTEKVQIPEVLKLAGYKGDKAYVEVARLLDRNFPNFYGTYLVTAMTNAELDNEDLPGDLNVLPRSLWFRHEKNARKEAGKMLENIGKWGHGRYSNKPLPSVVLFYALNSLFMNGKK